MPSLIYVRDDKNGKPIWRLNLHVGTDDAGKQIVKVHSFHGTKREAILWRDRLLFAENKSPRKNITVTQYIENWLELKKEELKPKTLLNYKQHLYNHVIPEIGKLKIADITSDNIKKVMRRLENKNITGATALRHFRTMSSLFQNAVYDGYLEINPVRQVKPPSTIKKESEFYDIDTIRILIEELKKEDFPTAVPLSIAINTGLRRGEIIALTWDDIEFQNKRISVNKSCCYVDGIQTRVSPKTSNSTRYVPMTKQLMQLLSNAKLSAKTENVCEYNGAWMKYHHTSDLLKYFIDKIKTQEIYKQFPNITYHKLRHTMATILIKNGVGVRDISAILGHAQTSTTLNIYSHSFLKSQEEAITIFENVFLKE